MDTGFFSFLTSLFELIMALVTGDVLALLALLG